MVLFLKSSLRYPHLNFFLFIRFITYLIKRLIKKITTPFINSINRILNIDVRLFSLTFNGRSKHLKPFYKEKKAWLKKKEHDYWYESLPYTGWKTSLNNKSTSQNMPFCLASEKVFFMKNSKIDWYKEYNDSEDTMSLHRFDWLISMLALKEKEKLPEKGVSWILDWLENEKNLNNRLIWDSYTVSERIVNWLIFLCCIKPFIKDDSFDHALIRSSIVKQIKLVALNLDYWGSKTNNHIINNARALYISGRLLKIKYAEKIGLSIIKNETDKLIPNGVLAEGSTHYQFLITRTYLEIFWFASRTHDKMTCAWINHRLSKMLKSCRFISMEGNNIPFIGDISPDYPPTWLFGYPFTTEKKNTNSLSPWSLIWGNLKEFDNLLKNIDTENSSEKNSIVLINEQWLKLQKNNITVFSSIINNNISSHIHQDQGGICLYYENFPILIDPGLWKYTWNNPIIRFQSGVSSHSTISINNIGLFPSKLSLLHPMNNYFSKYRINYKKIENGYKYFMKGFRVLGRWLNWDREVYVKRNELVINDYVDCPRKDEEIQISYVFDNKIKFNDQLTKGSNGIISFDLSIIGNTKEKSILPNTNKNIKSGYNSNYYGDLNPCKIINLSFYSHDPLIITTKYKFYRIS